MNKSDRYSVITVFAVTVLFRAAVIFLWRDGTWSGPMNGELGQVAANLAEGRGFSSPLESGTAPTAWFGPVVPCFWAAVFRIAGVNSGLSVLLLQLLQCLLGGVCGVVYLLIARELWHGNGGKGEKVPFLVALVVCLWPVGIPRYNFLWYFVWEDAAIALLCLAGIRWCRDSGWRATVLVGIFAGVGGLVNVIPLTAFAGLLCLRMAASGGYRTALAWKQCAVAALVACAILLPWAFRNLSVLDQWIPARTGFGMGLMQGNGPDGSIVQTLKSRHPALMEEEKRRYDELGEAMYNKVTAEEAVSYMMEHKGVTLQRMAQRFYVFWFTDMFDNWPWQTGAPWWHAGAARKLWRTTQIVANLLSLGLAVWCLLSSKMLRGFPVIIVFLLFMPIPYYLTTSGWAYGHIVRPYVVILGAMGLLVHRYFRGWRGIICG